MLEWIKIVIGVFVLALGIPAGNFIARLTKEELKPGQKWFKLIVLFGLIGGVVGLVLGDDVLMFALFFIAVVGSRSLQR